MKPIRYHGRTYVPKLRDDGLLTARASIAYGSGARKGTLMFTVYLLVTACTGNKKNVYKVPALREWQQRGLPKEEQCLRAQFMLDIVAVQQACELHLHEPIRPK